MPIYDTSTIPSVRVPTSANIVNDFGPAILAMAQDLKLAIVTALPGSPADGQEVLYQPAAFTASPYTTDNEVPPWHLRYRAGSGSTSKWDVIGGVPLEQRVSTQESRSGAYADIATVGPSITAPATGIYDVRFGAFVTVDSGTQITAQVGLKIGAGTAGAGGNLLAFSGTAAGAPGPGASISGLAQAIAITSGTVLKLQYATDSGTAEFGGRWLQLVPRRLG